MRWVIHLFFLRHLLKTGHQNKKKTPQRPSDPASQDPTRAMGSEKSDPWTSRAGFLASTGLCKLSGWLITCPINGMIHGVHVSRMETTSGGLRASRPVFHEDITSLPPHSAQKCALYRNFVRPARSFSRFKYAFTVSIPSRPL